MACRRVLRWSASDIQQDQCGRAILLVLPVHQPSGQEGDSDLAQRWPWLLFSGRSSAGEWTISLAVRDLEASEKPLDLGESYQCGLGRAVSSVRVDVSHLELIQIPFQACRYWLLSRKTYRDLRGRRRSAIPRLLQELCGYFRHGGLLDLYCR